MTTRGWVPKLDTGEFYPCWVSGPPGHHVHCGSVEVETLQQLRTSPKKLRARPALNDSIYHDKVAESMGYGQDLVRTYYVDRAHQPSTHQFCLLLATDVLYRMSDMYVPRVSDSEGVN